MAALIPFETRSDSSEGEQLGNRIAQLNAYLDVAQAEFLELLCEFDEQRYREDLGFTSCAHWLNFKSGIGLNAARERLRMAHAPGTHRPGRRLPLPRLHERPILRRSPRRALV